MPKKININVGVSGTEQTKRDMNSIARSTKGVGKSTEVIGKSAKLSEGRFTKALGGMKSAIGSLIGPLGIAAIATAAGAAIGKAIKYFDDLKAKTDRAVGDVETLRNAYESLFEAVGAFDEQSRENVTKNTALLLQKTGVSKQLGIPIVNEYTRQFRGQVDSGQLSQDDYTEGLEGMLGYGARHGGSATKELVQMMKGWGMNTPDQQGELRRQIAAGAAQSGLTDEDMINSLARSGPTIKALSWTPEQAIENVAILAAGESGRKKMSLPSTTIQALMAPQVANAKKFGIPDEVAADPERLYEAVKQSRDTMEQKDYVRMLTQLYGTEGAAGVYKLSTAPRGGIAGDLATAAGTEGIQAEQLEEQQRMNTLESRSAQADAMEMWYQLDLTEKEKYDKLIRHVGEAKQEQLERRQPVREAFRKLSVIGNEREKEHAAFTAWKEGLSDEDRETFDRATVSGRLDIYELIWKEKTSKRKFQSLSQQLPLPADDLTAPPIPREAATERQPLPVDNQTAPKITQIETPNIEVPNAPPIQQRKQTEPAVPVIYNTNIHHHNETIYTPRVGNDNRGPRIGSEVEN